MNIYCFDWRRNPMPASDSKSIGFISFGFAVMYSMSNLAVRYLDSWNILVASAFPAKNSIHCRGAGSFRRGHPNFTLFSGSIPKKIYRFTPFSLGTMACGFEQSTVLPSLALLGASAWGLGYRALIRGPPRGLGVTVDLLSM